MNRYARKIVEDEWDGGPLIAPPPPPKFKLPMPTTSVVGNRAKKIVWERVESSMITHLAYEKPDTAEGRLWVRFSSGGTYYYIGVPYDVYEDGRDAESVGRWWHQNIKGYYECYNQIGAPLDVKQQSGGM